MERITNGIVISLDCVWDDLGSFKSLKNIKPKDKNNNVLEGDVIVSDTKNSYIYSNNKLISTIGVKDLFIIDTEDALLVADKNKSQDIKKIVDTLKESNREEINLHHKVYRPWGSYELMGDAEHYKIKHII